MVMAKKSRMSEWFDAPRDEVAKRTMRAAKGYVAHKSEVLSSQFAHPEHMEEAELRAEQISNIQKEKNNPDEESA
jgi:hypothetical protein